MAKYVPVLKNGGGACCDCSNQEGCVCEGEACALGCQYKESDAALCGFSEFGDTPSVPPKKYRQLTIGENTPGEPFTECDEIPSDDCSLPDCFRDVQIDYVGDVPGIGHVVSTGQFVFSLAVSPSVDRYKAQNLHTTVDGVDTETAIFVNGPNVRLHEGETVDLTHNTLVTVGLQYNYITWNEPATGCVITGSVIITRFNDNWAVSSIYTSHTSGPSAGSCTGPSNDNTSYSMKAIDTCDPAVTGALDGTRILDDPETKYGSGSAITVTDTVEQHVVGIGCVDGLDGTSRQYTGNIKEVLTVEDTEEDAVARANSVIGSWTGQACDLATSFKTLRGAGEFTFGYRSVQVRATAGDLTHPLIPGHSYKVTFHYKWRVLGTGGPYTDYGTDDITFVASATIQTTDWVDMPMEDAKEIRTFFCELLDVT